MLRYETGRSARCALAAIAMGAALSAGIALPAAAGTSSTQTGARTAQADSIRFRLLDAESREPIVAAAFQYGNQKGHTGSSGWVRLEQVDGLELLLSHVRYGTARLSAAQLEETARAGVYRWEPRTEDLEPVVVLSIRAPEGGSAMVKVGTSEVLSHDAGAVLEQVDGISGVRKSGSYGVDPVLRGLRGNQLQVIMDQGLTAAAACPNRMDPPTSQIMLNMVERVDVIKGPYALRYGGGFGGTVQFRSPDPVFSPEPRMTGRLTTGYESNGAILSSEAMAGVRTRDAVVRLFGSWSRSNGYADGDGVEIPSGYDRGSLGMNATLRLNPAHTLTLNANMNRASDAEFATLGMDLISDETVMGSLVHRFMPAGGRLTQIETAAWGSHVDHLMTNELRTAMPSMPKMMDMETAANTSVAGARTEAQWDSDSWRLYAGGDVKMEEATGERERTMLMGPMAGRVMLDSPWQESRQIRAGGFAELQLHQGVGGLPVKGVLAARLDVDRAETLDRAVRFDAVNPEDAPTRLLPSLSAGVSREWDSGWRLGVWAGWTARAPSLTERYMNSFPVGVDPYELVGDPLLDPEKLAQVDLSASWTAPGFQVSVNGFRSAITDFISSRIDPSLQPVTPMSPGVRRFVNVDRAVLQGVEASASHVIGGGASHRASVSYTHGEIDGAGPVPEIPPLELTYTLMGRFLGARVQPELSIRHVLAQDRVSTEFGEFPSKAFTTVDVMAEIEFVSWGSLHIGVHNLLDETYAEHLSRTRSGTGLALTAPGRSLMTRLSVRLPG